MKYYDYEAMIDIAKSGRLRAANSDAVQKFNQAITRIYRLRFLVNSNPPRLSEAKTMERAINKSFRKAARLNGDVTA